MEAVIYLLHFDRPLGDATRPHMSARHYLGWAPDDAWVDRVTVHIRGKGASITRAAVQRGIRLELVRLWEGDRTRERQMKQNGGFARRCPRCRKEAGRR